jgi:hypothetical protein
LVIPEKWDRVSDADWWVYKPFQKLCDKYFDRGTVLSLEYDLYPIRRAIDPGWANRIEAADLAVTITMNSRVEYGDMDRVIARRDRIESGLRRIPIDLDLGSADLSNADLIGGLHDAFAGFRTEYVSVAKAAKVLCLKRPRLIPMLDSLVRKAIYSEVPPDAPTDPDDFAALLIDEVRRFQRALNHRHPDGRTNRAEAARLAEAFAVESVRRNSGDDRSRLRLSAARVYENLVWFEQDGAYEQFDYVSDEPNRRVKRREE